MLSPSAIFLLISVIDFALISLILKFTMQSFPINSTDSTLTLNNGLSLNSKYSGLIPTI